MVSVSMFSNGCFWLWKIAVQAIFDCSYTHIRSFIIIIIIVFFSNLFRFVLFVYVSIDTIHNAKASANVINFKTNPEILIFFHSKKTKILYICVVE